MSDPTFTRDLDTLPLDELRERRHVLDDLDRELSYYRRILHGRMDLLAFELRRRSGEETRSLIEALPEILADSPTGDRETLPKALPVEPPELPARGRRAIDRALGNDFLARLPELDDAELEEIQRGLTEAERAVSAQRRTVYEAHEQILAELTRRYRTGLADVDELLPRR